MRSKIKVRISRIIRLFAWLILSLSLSFLAAWSSLAEFNFNYPAIHNYLKIGETVRIYGPQNKYKHQFELTSYQQQYQLFGQINQAVNSIKVVNIDQLAQQLKRVETELSEIKYYSAEGQLIDHLLHQSEITHLIDVSRLLVRVKQGAVIASFIAVVLILICHLYLSQIRHNIFKHTAIKPIPSLGSIYLTMLAIGLFGMAILAVWGAKDIFYQLHIWLFPPNHQWFFYYQDSLMSTLMQAPNLFGVIAIELGVFIVVFQFVFLAIARRIALALYR